KAAANSTQPAVFFRSLEVLQEREKRVVRWRVAHVARRFWLLRCRQKCAAQNEADDRDGAKQFGSGIRFAAQPHIEVCACVSPFPMKIAAAEHRQKQRAKSC